jgi:Cu/Zn superoxide dismutase
MRYRQRLVWLLAISMVVLYAIPVLAGPGSFFRGQLTDLEPGMDRVTDGAWAVASATVQNGRTIVRLNTKDLDGAWEGDTFGAHVHVGPCAAGNGGLAGPHYNAGGGVSPETEVWLDFTVNGGRTGHAVAVVPFEITPGAARSIVIHALPTAPDGTAGARLACLPLEF